MSCDGLYIGTLVYCKGAYLFLQNSTGFVPPTTHLDNYPNVRLAAVDSIQKLLGIQITLEKPLVLGASLYTSCDMSSRSHEWWVFTAPLPEGSKPQAEGCRAVWFTWPQITKLIQPTQRYLNRGITTTEWQRKPGLDPGWADMFRLIRMAAKGE